MENKPAKKNTATQKKTSTPFAQPETVKAASGGSAYIFRNAKLPEPVEKVAASGRVSWGEKNVYAQWLQTLRYNSGIHGGIINQKVKFITGGGIEYTGPDGATFEKIRKNPDGITIDQIMTGNNCPDFEVLESFATLFKKDASTGTWYAYPLDTELIRPLEENGVLYWEYSENWLSSSQSLEKTGYMKYIDLDDRNTTKDDICVGYYKTMPKQSLMDNGKLTANWFPTPSYSGGIKDICTSIEISHFHYSETANGFKGGVIVNMNNGFIEDNDIRNSTERNLKDSASNRDTQGGMIIIYNDGVERATTIEQMNGNDLDRRYITTDESITQKIMIAHSVINPVLWGVKTDNALGGGSEELMTAYLIYKTNHAVPRQEILATQMTYWLKELNGIKGEISYKEYTPSFEYKASENEITDSLNGLSPQLQSSVLESMTINEKRALAKLPPIAGGDMLQSSTPVADPSQQQVLNAFSAAGRPRIKMKVVHSRAITEFGNVERSELELMDSFSAQNFAALTPVQSKILTAVSEGKAFTEIASDLRIRASVLTAELIKLEKGGFLQPGKGNSDLELTENGAKAVATKQTMKVVYSYELRPDAPALVPGGSSREFCTELIKMDKVYTREEINKISSAIGRDVWQYRGGWYHNPSTDKNQPSCRHYWKQNLIIE